MYGGSAGGGKSDALLMGALQYVDTPGYSALLLRRTYADLSLPGALMDRAHEWLGPTAARWRDVDKTWSFPSGAKVTFGYLEHEKDIYRYQSAAFQFCGYDELTQFTEPQYRYLFSRLRRLTDSDVPLRMRAASNPGGVGHEWVKQRFLIEGRSQGRVFIPATLMDNPFLDQEAYRESLQNLDPVTRQQLLDGDWSARQPGGLFRREWFEIVAESPAPAKWVRFWDKASTEPEAGKNPDWTAGVLLGTHDGLYYVKDVKRLRTTPRGVEQVIAQTAAIDGELLPVRIEQEPGSSGVDTIDHYRRRVLRGYNFRGIRSTGSKVERAGPVSSAAEAGNVKLVRGPWIGDYLDELEAFPEGSHDDQVDATSGCLTQLMQRAGGIGGFYL